MEVTSMDSFIVTWFQFVLHDSYKYLFYVNTRNFNTIHNTTKIVHLSSIILRSNNDLFVDRSLTWAKFTHNFTHECVRNEDPLTEKNDDDLLWSDIISW